MKSRKSSKKITAPVVSSDALADSIRKKYTYLRPCVVGGDDKDAVDPCTVWIKVGNQSFCLDGYRDTKDEGEWMRVMLAEAIANIVREFMKDSCRPTGAALGQ